MAKLKVTNETIINIVSKRDPYYTSKFSQKAIDSFCEAIKESIGIFKCSNPDIYQMWLVCGNRVRIDTKGVSKGFLIDWCKSELAQDVHYWNYYNG